MNKFHQGKIYKITDHTNNNIYVGSTIQTLKQRLRGHERDAYHPLLNCSSKELILNNEYSIDLLIDYPCDSCCELRKKEQEFIDIISCVNKANAYVSPEDKKIKAIDFYNSNKKDILESKKVYDQVYYECECGGRYNMSHRARHLNCEKCKNYFNLKNNLATNINV